MKKKAKKAPAKKSSKNLSQRMFFKESQKGFGGRRNFGGDFEGRTGLT